MVSHRSRRIHNHDRKSGSGGLKSNPLGLKLRPLYAPHISSSEIGFVSFPTRQPEHRYSQPYWYKQTRSTPAFRAVPSGCGFRPRWTGTTHSNLSPTTGNRRPHETPAASVTARSRNSNPSDRQQLLQHQSFRATVSGRAPTRDTMPALQKLLRNVPTYEARRSCNQSRLHRRLAHRCQASCRPLCLGRAHQLLYLWKLERARSGNMSRYRW